MIYNVLSGMLSLYTTTTTTLSWLLLLGCGCHDVIAVARIPSVGS